MRKIYMAGVSAVALTAIASPALSQSPAPEIPAGLYLAAGLGFALGFDRDFDHNGGKPNPSSSSPDVPNPFNAADQNFSTAPIFEGAIGYDFGPSIRIAKLGENALGARVEFQASFIDFDANDIDPVVTGSDSPPPGDRAGHLDVTLLMANLLLDIDTGSPLTPYVGVGVGAALSTIDSGVSATEAPPWVRFDDASDTGVAWQIIAGASVAVAPNLDLYGNYRLIGLPLMTADAVHPPEKDVDFDSQLAHSFTFGMRYTFGP